MGGKALKNTETRRFLKEEFETISATILRELQHLFPLARMEIIRYYRNKQDFGDLDILVESSKLPEDYVEQIKTSFQPKEMGLNGTCWSFDHNQLQVDFIKIPTKDYDIAKVYFAYNDLGNLMGRMADQMGFKYGHRGLLFFSRRDDHIAGEILVSQNPRKIFEFLGFDYDRHSQGFNELSEVFDFVINSQYFYKDCFLLENRNNKGRTRDRKRKVYTQFLEYIEKMNPSGNPLLDRSFYEKKAERFFELFKEQKEDLSRSLDEKELLASKFYGNLVKALTGKEGPNLGDFICRFKKQHSDFDDWVKNTSPEDIEEAIKNFE